MHTSTIRQITGLSRHFERAVLARNSQVYLYQIHAGIVKFDGKGMLLSPVGWLWLRLYMRGRRAPKVNRGTVDWDE